MPRDDVWRDTHLPDQGSDAEAKRLDAKLSEAEWSKRRAGWKKPALRVERGVLAKYARTVHSASEGAVTG